MNQVTVLFNDGSTIFFKTQEVVKTIKDVYNNYNVDLIKAVQILNMANIK